MIIVTMDRADGSTLDPSQARSHRSSCGSLFAQGALRDQCLAFGASQLRKLDTVARSTLRIPYFHVLWAELPDDRQQLTLRYAAPNSKKDDVRVACVTAVIDKEQRLKTRTWIDRLLDRAYGQVQRRKRVQVLVNPVGGQGKAVGIFEQHVEPIFVAAQCRVDAVHTTYQGHAADLAEKMNLDDHDVVACCSGDGLPHEVFNGLGRRKDAGTALRRMAVVQVPCGSGNAMSWNLFGTANPSLAAVGIVKGVRTSLDLVSISQANRPRLLSFLSQAVGLVADSDLGTDHLRWMGETRFLYGFLTRLLRKHVYPCDIMALIDLDDKDAIRVHYDQALQRLQSKSSSSSSSTSTTTTTLVPSPEHDGKEIDGGQEEEGGEEDLLALRYGDINNNLPTTTSTTSDQWTLLPYPNLGTFYSGNMAYMASDGNFFPAALPRDGYTDMITIDGDISASLALRTLASVARNSFFNLAHVRYRKVRAYRLVPRPGWSGFISIDGESIPFAPFQAELLPGLATVLSKRVGRYEAPGPM